MFKQFFFAAFIVLTATMTMSFSTITPNFQSVTTAPKSGNSLTVTNSSPGTASLNWSFNQPSLVYIYIIEDVVHRQVVRSGQTSQTSCSVSGLTSGTYRITVSNGSNYVIIEEEVIM